MNDDKVEVILTWSEPDGVGGHHMGSGGETTRRMGCAALWKLITRGRRADSGEEVTSVTIFTAVRPQLGGSQGNEPEECAP